MYNYIYYVVMIDLVLYIGQIACRSHDSKPENANYTTCIYWNSHYRMYQLYIAHACMHGHADVL